MWIWHATAVVLAGIRGAVARLDTLMCIPLVDAHQAIPTWAAFTQVWTSAPDLDRRTGLS